MGPNFASNLLVRYQSCTVHGKMLFQLAWNEGLKCSCLDVIIQSCCHRSARIASFVSARKFLPLLESCGKNLQFAPIWNEGVSQKCSAFSSTQRINDGPNVAAPPDLMVLLQERCRSFRVLSRLRVQHGLVRSFPEHRPLVLHPADRTFFRVHCS